MKLKQYRAVVKEGANHGIALSCVLLADGWASFRIDDYQKKQMYEVAAQRLHPIAILKMAENLWDDNIKLPEIFKLYYWYLLAERLEIGDMHVAINKIEYTIYGGK